MEAEEPVARSEAPFALRTAAECRTRVSDVVMEAILLRARRCAAGDIVLRSRTMLAHFFERLKSSDA